MSSRIRSLWKSLILGLWQEMAAGSKMKGLELSAVCASEGMKNLGFKCWCVNSSHLSMIRFITMQTWSFWALFVISSWWKIVISSCYKPGELMNSVESVQHTNRSLAGGTEDLNSETHNWAQLNKNRSGEATRSDCTHRYFSSARILLILIWKRKLEKQSFGYQGFGIC